MNNATILCMELDKRDTNTDLQHLLVLRDRIGNLHNALEGKSLEPKVDLLDEGNAYRLIIDVPGIAQDDLEVAIQERQVIIAGIRKPHKSGKSLISERASGHFQRMVDLPSDVDWDVGSAHLAEGLLVLHLPKV